MTHPVIPFDMDPKYPPRFEVVMQTDHDIPPDLLLSVLTQTFALDRKQAEKLALPILYHESGSFGAYSREIAEAKAFTLNRFMMQHGRLLATGIQPCQGGRLR